MIIITTIYTTIYTIIYTYIYTIYKKKKEESKEERRNIYFLQSFNIRLFRVWLQGNIVQIAEWGLFHSCSFKVITMENQTIMTHKEKVEETTIESITHKNATVSKKQLIAMWKLGQFRKELVQEFIDYCIADIESKKAK